MSSHIRRAIWFLPLALLLALFSMEAVAAPNFIALEVNKCRFQPTHIKLRPSADYYLVVQSRSALGEHDFVVDDPQKLLQIQRVFSRSELQIYSLHTGAAGKYSFFCRRSIPFVPEQEVTGSSGVLEVQAP